ncbi:hypothetical protein EDB85DRAFT_2197055 [Lactarius pseudohatsudake]|nr:hypothetical protein EDB85DRAFT_2197055 [Lactarius pseudohatsudake]
MPRLSISVISWYFLSIGPRPSFMNPVTWSALSHELLIGPLSELVDLGDFLRGARDNSVSVFTPEPLALLQQARRRPSPTRRMQLIEIFNDPRLYVHARRVHDTSVNAIYEQAERNTSKKRKRKPEVVSELEDTPDLTALRKGLADIKPKSWPLPLEAAIFMRGPKNSDINTLAGIKYSSNGSNLAPQSTIVVVSALEDLYNAIPCPSNETPDERVVDGTFVGYGTGCSTRPSGCVVVIEGTAYGDGSTETNYASKFFAHISNPLSKGPKMRDTSTFAPPRPSVLASASGKSRTFPGC